MAMRTVGHFSMRVLVYAHAYFSCAHDTPPRVQHFSAFHIDCDLSFSTVNPMDYLELNSTLSFDACQNRSCINVTIVDDMVDEPLEYFDFTLEKTPDLDTRISLNPVDGRIAIIDNDGKSLICMKWDILTTIPFIPPQFQFMLAMSSQYTLHLRERAW